MGAGSQPSESPRFVTLGLQLLGALAGLATLTTFVGGAMLWIRFSELHLPADQAVNLLPKQLLLVIGAHALIGPVALGLFAAVVISLAQPLRTTGYDWIFWLLLAAILVPFVVAVVVLTWDFDRFPEQFFMALALLAALAIVIPVAIRATRRTTIALSVLAAFAICGAVLAVVRTSGAPKLEPVAVLLDGRPQAIAGFYVGQTADRLYLAPLPGNGDPADPFADADIDRIVEIRRDRVVALVLREPTGIRSNEPGREQAQSLLADLRAATAEPGTTVADTVTTSDPVTAFAPLVNLHVRERAWPMSADAFLADAWLTWVHEDCPDWVPDSAGDGGRHVEHASDHADLLGRFEPARLAGPGAYAHVPVSKGCADATGAPISASAHTRPYDGKGRPAGVAVSEGWVLDLRDGARTPKPKLRDEGPQRILSDVPAYYEVHPPLAEGTAEVRITYWLFYGLSQPPGPSSFTRFLVHEGDWERISVLLRRGATHDDYTPVSVRYHAHDGSRDVAWSAVKRSGTHPLVFSARGSHASYWRAGAYENVFEADGRRQFAVRDTAIACPDCPQWRTWDELRDAQTQPWYGFGGSWGQFGGMAGTTGPLGPSSYKVDGASPSPVTTVERATAPIAPAPSAAP